MEYFIAYLHVNVSESHLGGLSPLRRYFWHKELYLRCCIELELNVVTKSAKILKCIGEAPHQDQAQSWKSTKITLA